MADLQERALDPAILRCVAGMHQAGKICPRILPSHGRKDPPGWRPEGP